MCIAAIDYKVVLITALPPAPSIKLRYEAYGFTLNMNIYIIIQAPHREYISLLFRVTPLGY